MDKYGTEERTVDFAPILRRLWKNALLIFLICALCAATAYAFFSYRRHPVFSADTEIYVFTGATYSDTMMSDKLAEDAKTIIKNVTVMENVIDEMQLDMTPSALSSKITVTAPSDTRTILITVKDGDPFRCAEIANCVREKSSEKLQSVMSLEAVNTISEARIPTSSGGNGAFKMAVIAFIAAFICCFGVIAVLEVFNDRITSPEDIEKSLGITTLGSIPYVSKNADDPAE